MNISISKSGLSTFPHGSLAHLTPDLFDIFEHEENEYEDELTPFPAFWVTVSAYNEMLEYLCRRQPEAGGLLVGPRSSELVTHFIPDENGHATSVSFTLHAPSLNEKLKALKEWSMDAKGLVHSHPAGMRHPSAGDLKYVNKSFMNPKNKDATTFYLPIVCDGELYPYAVYRDEPNEIHRCALVLV